MGQPAARQTDPVTGVDVHIVMVPAPPGAPVPTPLPHPFAGQLTDAVSTDVLIGGLAAATIGSVAQNLPPHLPTPPGTAFQRPPTNRGSVLTGSATVLINGKGAARLGDTVTTCNDPANAPVSTITGGSPTVLIG
ncbi:PAAR domain-containing protein [soil metagenome]